MRICMIVSVPLPPGEGIGFYTWNLSRHLSKLGNQVQIITRGDARSTGREVVEGIAVWRPTFLPIYPIHVHLHSLFVNKLLHQLEPEVDLFHLHTPLVKLPKIKLPILVTVHTPMRADAGSVPTNNLLGWLVKLQAPVSYKLEAELFKYAHKLTAVAHSVAHELKAYNISPQQVEVLGNGVDTDIFCPSNCGPDLDRPYFLTAGRLGPRKGLEDLIQCAEYVVNQYPNYRFYIAGSGPCKRKLQTEIRRRKLESHVILLGHITNRAKLVALYQGATAYIHVAHYEGLPTVLLEAMACGRPVVTTAVSGALDVVQDGHNGLLVSAQAPKETATAIIRLLRQPSLGEELGAAACKTVKERYAWPLVSRNYLAQYESLLEGARS